jgi:arginine decarboxylase
VSAVSATDPREPDGRPPGAGVLPVRLPVLGATASARTGLAAFHRTLVAVGLGHYNLVRLSSVIPPGTEVGTGRPSGGRALPAAWRGSRPYDFVDGQHGDRLYCVYAERRTDVPGEAVWAGVGWVHRSDGQGGYFVEHDGTTSEAVLDELRTSLAEMVADEPVSFEPPQWVLEGTVCEGDPVCALVVVPYVATAW